MEPKRTRSTTRILIAASRTGRGSGGPTGCDAKGRYIVSFDKDRRRDSGRALLLPVLYRHNQPPKLSNAI